MTNKNSGDADIEIQDELDNILNDDSQENEDQDTGAEENEDQDTEDDGAGSDDEQGEPVKIDKKSPEYKAGQKDFQQTMQAAFDKRISAMFGKTEEFKNTLRLEFTQKMDELKKSVTPPKPQPKIQDFETEEEFIRALVDHSLGDKVPAKQAPQGGQGDNNYQWLPGEQQFMAKEQAYVATNPGYTQKVNQLSPFLSSNPQLKEAIFATDPAVAEYLSDNLELVSQFHGKTPAQIGAALGAIQSRVSKGQAPSKQPKPKPKPVTETNGVQSSGKSIYDLTQAEYNKKRRELDRQ